VNSSLGARLGGASSELANSFATYGFLLGLAFQIRDDCLDLGGDAMVIGKECCKDISERNATLPLILALPSMSRDERRRVRSTFEEEQAIDNVWFVKAISENGGIQKSMEIARDFAERASRRVGSQGELEAPCFVLGGERFLERLIIELPSLYHVGSSPDENREVAEIVAGARYR
jgi:geranylgeranyl pyrophosphate synthase